MSDPRRTLPAVSALLESDAVRAFMQRSPRAVVTDAIRDTVRAAREHPEHAPRAPEEWDAAIGRALERRVRASLRPVFNATGVVLHTNLGRAPLAASALDAVLDVARGFSNLEYDLGAGARGSRYTHCVALLRELTGAADAIVVNNCAGALVLALNTLAEGRDAIVSRGELVEIGGSFRVPDIMAKSGARLLEIGTTNRTHVDDYRRVLTAETGVIVKVHRSNFALQGFVADAAVAQLAPVAREFGVPILHDLGSGLLIPLDEFGLTGEPTAADALRDGAALVLMSGDKLLGGPQAGIIAGDARLVAALQRNPLARALRVDKMTLAALEATLALYREPARALREIPVLAMLCAPAARIRARAESLATALRDRGVPASLQASEASVGGGAFPMARIASSAVRVAGDAVALERALREGSVPVIARIADGHLLMDLRGVPEPHDDAFQEAVLGALAPAI